MSDKVVYRYRAIAKGVLSVPRYRFVEEGEIVESSFPLKGKWLIDADAPVPKKSDILVPYMKINGKVQRPNFDEAPIETVRPGSAKPVVDPVYDRALEGLKKAEGIVDDAAKKKKEGGAGTGNQDVL